MGKSTISINFYVPFSSSQSVTNYQRLNLIASQEITIKITIKTHEINITIWYFLVIPRGYQLH